MEVEELIAKLIICGEDSDTEKAHGVADDLLIEFINNDDVKRVYEGIDKWYA